MERPDTVYSLQPANSVAQTLLPQSQTLGELPAMSVPEAVVNAGPATPQQQTMMDKTPVQLGQLPQMAQVANPAIVNPLVQAYQQQINSYDNPWYKQHPILTRLIGAANYGLSGLFSAPQIAQQLVDANKLKAIQGLQAAQQQADTNRTHFGAYNALAQNAGLPQAAPNAVIGDKDLEMAQALVQKYGAPALMKARDQFNQDTINYNRAQQAAATYQARQRAGLLTPEETKIGAPVVPAAPVFNIEGINPYLDAGSVAGVTGTSGEAANTGQKSGSDAAEGAAKEKEADARLAELKNNLEFQKQSHEDSIAMQKATLQNNQSQFDQTQSRLSQDHQDTQQNRIQTRLATDAKDSNQMALKELENVRTINHQLQELVGKVPASKIRSDARYLKLNSEYRAAQERYNAAKTDADAKQARYQQYAGNPQTEAQPRPAATSAAPQTGKALNQNVPTVKIKIPRELALKYKLLK